MRTLRESADLLSLGRETVIDGLLFSVVEFLGTQHTVGLSSYRDLYHVLVYSYHEEEACNRPGKRG